MVLADKFIFQAIKNIILHLEVVVSGSAITVESPTLFLRERLSRGSFILCKTVDASGT